MATTILRWYGNRGANSWDVPSALLDGQVMRAHNLTLERGTLGRKRHGSVAVPITGVSHYGALALIPFVPGQDDSAAELFIVTNEQSLPPSGAPTKILRVAAGTAAVSLSLIDPVTGQTWNARGAMLNGKLFLAYPSAGVNRLHVFSPSESLTAVRRVGLAAGAVGPTVTNSGAGSYPAVLRYYRIQWLTYGGPAGQVMLRKSNLGPATSFTPSGTGSGALIDATAAQPHDGENSFIVWGSVDDLSYFQVSPLVTMSIVMSYLDTAAPSTYASNTAAPEEGAYTPWPSVKYLLSDGERLIGFGVWETAAGDSHPPKDGRVYFSPVLDTTAVGYSDEERVSNSLTFKGWIDVARNSGAEDRALVGPIDNQILVGQSRGIYLLIPTGQASVPYRRVVLSRILGMVSQESTFMGEDEEGRACVYFLDPERGPYRYGANGLEWLGYDVQGQWAQFNPAASIRPAMGVYQRAERKCFWLIATTGQTPDLALWFHVREGVREKSEGVRYGWTTGTIPLVPNNEAHTAAPASLTMFAATMGATMSRNLKPYLGFNIDTTLLRTDDAAAIDDAGLPYQAFVDSPIFDGNDPRREKSIARGNAWLSAKANAGVQVNVMLTRNYGDSANRFSVADLTPEVASQTRVRVKLSDAALADALTFQVSIGDGSARPTTWTVDSWEALIDVSSKDGGSTGR